MRKTYRMQRGFVSILIIVFLSCIWLFFHWIYPLILKTVTIIHFPHIDSRVFLIPIALITIGLFICWSWRNKLWLGPSYAVRHYFTIKRIRRHIKDAKFEEQREYDKGLVRLPKIVFFFNDKNERKTGEVWIKNSVKFDKKLQDIKLDSALKHYIIEAQNISKDHNWYIFEFFSVQSLNQCEIKSEKNLTYWAKETADDYQIRLDERSTTPFHHMGLAGVTGSGKSMFLQMLIHQVLNKNINHEFYVIDPKRADIFQLSKQLIGNERTADTANAFEMIRNFHQKVIKRQQELEGYLTYQPNINYENAHMPALILLIDEYGAFNSFLNSKTIPREKRNEITRMLEDIARMGRQLGCFLWIASQQINAKAIATEITDQLVLKIVLGSSGEQTYRTLFDTGVDIPRVKFTPGRGVFSYPELANEDTPRLLSVPFCSFLT